MLRRQERLPSVLLLQTVRTQSWTSQSLMYPPLLLCTNNDAGWKLVFGQCLQFEHDIRGKLTTVYGAGEHYGESVLLMTSGVERTFLRIT